jgi:putative IMPACT (imprinted ancient) family translation regulator
VETAVNAVFSDKEVAARPGKEHLEILRKVHAVQFSKVDQRKFKGKIESKYGKQKNMR